MEEPAIITLFGGSGPRTSIVPDIVPSNYQKEFYMGFFNSILQKLGLGKKEDEKLATAASAGKKVGAARTASSPYTPGIAQPAAISEVDVVKKLEGLAAGTNLDWKLSIVDLLKLLDIDSSREARNELAKELGCPVDLMGDSAKMNTWLHKQVLKKIAANGGNIPKELLD
jgi:hypothetical protein